MGYSIHFGADYPLSNPVTNFYGYLFITSDKYLRGEHQFQDGGRMEGNVLVQAGNGKAMRVLCSGTVPAEPDGMLLYMGPDLAARKQLRDFAGKALKARYPGYPDTDGISCVLIDVKDEEGEYDPAGYEPVMEDICNMFSDWCRENDRGGVIVWHAAQKGRPPHLHALYTRKDGKHDEFQEWLDGKLG